ncbi:MAG: coniferyl aldehyde dehydrogenase [Pseudomonadota bacterium]
MQDLHDILAAQRKAFDNDPYPSWAERRKKLLALGDAIQQNEGRFCQAISEDFGHRAQEETILAEAIVIRGGISHALRHTLGWMRPRRVPTALQFLPGRNRIHPQPLGVIGIISPWNYPLQLSVMPLIGALGAGNRVMLKPSELTPQFSLLLKEVLASVFDETDVHLATGGVDVAQSFSELPFDHLVFTGSTRVGRLVAQAAARNLTPCTLELGGKSPVIIDDSARWNQTVSRIANGKLLNSGQTCVAPDYVLMPPDRIERFATDIIAKAEQFYPSFADNDDYTSIVADNHFRRLQALVEDAAEKGATVRVAGRDDAQRLAKLRRMPLTVITGASPDMRVLQEEIFGPILPVLPSPDLDHAMATVRERDRPLALYWFGEDAGKRARVERETISGGTCINETAWHVVQENLPFGGVGPSGMGAYHGVHGFRSFSHMKGVFQQSAHSQGKTLYPPYTHRTHALLNLMKKIA